MSCKLQVIEEPPKNVAGEKKTEEASQAKADLAEDMDLEEEDDDADVSKTSSAGSAVFGLNGSMAQWLKQLAGGIGRSKADESHAAKKYQVRSAVTCASPACNCNTGCRHPNRQLSDSTGVSNWRHALLCAVIERRHGGWSLGIDKVFGGLDQEAKDGLRGRAGFTGELTVGEGQS